MLRIRPLRKRRIWISDLRGKSGSRSKNGDPTRYGSATLKLCSVQEKEKGKKAHTAMIEEALDESSDSDEEMEPSR